MVHRGPAEMQCVRCPQRLEVGTEWLDSQRVARRWLSACSLQARVYPESLSSSATGASGLPVEVTPTIGQHGSLDHKPRR